MEDKVLFLTHEQFSHAHDTFFNGCIEHFGAQNVFDYPCVEKNHSDYIIHGHSYAWWCINDIGHITSLSLEQWAHEINNGVIKYIVASSRGSGIENLKLLIPLITDSALKKACFIFLEEEEDAGFEVHRWCIEHLKPVYDKIDIHYKVDYIKGRVASYNKILPFYLSAPTGKILHEIGSVKPFDERKIDICYIAGNSHPNRLKYFDLLKSINRGNNVILFGEHKYSLHDYFNVINDSKIFISVRGNGWSNTRNVEGPSCGAALFSEKLQIEIPNDYVDGKSAIFFNESNLVSSLNEMLDSPKKLKTLAQNSIDHCLKNHTSFARAKQMVFDAKKIKRW